jgi:hypothetical protein
MPKTGEEAILFAALSFGLVEPIPHERLGNPPGSVEAKYCVTTDTYDRA